MSGLSDVSSVDEVVIRVSVFAVTLFKFDQEIVQD